MVRKEEKWTGEVTFLIRNFCNIHQRCKDLKTAKQTVIKIGSKSKETKAVAHKTVILLGFYIYFTGIVTFVK